MAKQYRKPVPAGGRTRHRRLRGALQSAGWSHTEVADALGISPTSVSNRMRGKYPWTVDEAWQIMSLLGISSRDMLGLLFPPGGMDDDG